jgi:hypothetical protein
MSFDWKGTIGTLAPTLAGIFGTPVAGVAVGALCKAFGLAPSPENAQALAEKAAAGSLSGDQLVLLRKAESDAKIALTKLGFDYNLEEDRLVISDRDSARKREIEIRDWTPRILAYGVTLGFFGLLVFMMKWNVPGPNKDMLNIMLGALGGAWIQIVSYYFGSSAGSSKKDETIKAIVA